MNQTILFYNWTEEDFTWKWNGEDFNFPAKTEVPFYNIPLTKQLSLRSHFAKHLVDRELTKLNKMMEDPRRAEMESWCNGSVEIVEEPKKEEFKNELVEKEVEKRKPGRPVTKKQTEMAESSLPEEEFAGLQK